MSELKTLKDLISEGYNPVLDSCAYVIKQEAIKWIKSEEMTSKNMFGDCGQEAIGFIEHFFNITEEDLR